MIEQWRDVVGYAGVYEVSSHGRVRRLLHGGVRVLKPQANNKGYARVGLYVGNRPKFCTVHRLVAEAFLGPPPLGHECAHADGNRQNNLSSNLRWCSPKENSDDKKAHGTFRIGEAHPGAKLTSAAVLDIRRRRGSGESGARLAAEFGVSRQAITGITSGRTWQHLVGA